MYVSTLFFSVSRGMQLGKISRGMLKISRFQDFKGHAYNKNFVKFSGLQYVVMYYMIM